MRVLLTIILLTYGCAVHSSQGDIDRLVAQSLKSRNIMAAQPCSDEVFIRRSYLVTTGRIPSPEVAAKFISSRSGDKRETLINKLLESDEFVENQVMKWGDLLRIKSEFSSNLWPNAVQAYNRWLKEQLRANVPYDRFVRELLLSSGSNFRVPQINFYRTHQRRSPEGYLADIALLFMGQRSVTPRLEPFFGQIRYKSTNEWKEEILYLDIDQPAPLQPVALPDLQCVKLRTGDDFRKPYVEWLTSTRNPMFARAIVNRVWYWIMGRGIVHECDDMRADNLAVNPPLLDFLASELVDNGYDLRHIFRIILSSDTFARSSIPQAETEDRGAELFAYYQTQRLGSETLIDAVYDLTGVPNRYFSRAPEPFTNYPDDIRAAQICDGTVTTSQLELFGRPSRDTSVESDRSNALNSKQVLFMINSSAIEDKIDKSPILERVVEETSGDKTAIIRDLYLRTISRLPTPAEQKKLSDYAAHIYNPMQFAQSLMWALINSDEFLFLH